MTWNEMMWELSTLGDFAEFMNIKTIGRSFRGLEIPMVSIGKGNKKILYVGAHRGTEGITTEIFMEYIKELLHLLYENKKIGGASPDLFIASRRVDIIPQLNPDGVEICENGISKDDIMYERLLKINKEKNFTLWQANGRGVDLTHNYNDMFTEHKHQEREMGILNGAPCKYSGEYPESEPECSALCSYIRSERPQNIISLHTQGEAIHYESRGHYLDESLKNALIASRLTSYPISNSEKNTSMGGLLDWVTRECKIPCLAFNCGKNPLPRSDTRSIYARLRPLLMSAPILFSYKTE